MDERRRPLQGTNAGSLKQTVTRDAFGRVASQTWWHVNPTPVAIDQYAYGYDRDGNVLWRDNQNAAAQSHPELGEYYQYNSLNAQSLYYRGTLTGSGNGRVITSANAVAPSMGWQVDSQGNRYGGKYGSSYDDQNRLAGANYTPAGTPGVVGFEAGNSSLVFDGWDRLARTQGADANPDRRYAYDALGRRISLKLVTDAATGAFDETRFFYDGDRVVEERTKTGQVMAQYVWGVDGTLVLRDRDHDLSAATTHTAIPNPGGTGLDERLYAFRDAAGSTTAVAGIDGVVLERYVYDQDGRPEARKADWALYRAQDVANDQTADVASRFDWQLLWHGGRWQEMYKDRIETLRDPETGVVLSRTLKQGGGLYEFNGRWYDAHLGRSLQPNPFAYAQDGRNA